MKRGEETMATTNERWIATRRTADGSIVHLWPGGSLTWALGRYIDGSPHPRTEEQAQVALRAGWLVLGEVELYSDGEVPALVRAARWTAERGLDPGDMRARLHRSRVRPAWTTLEADRDGRPRMQCWRLPRIRWPGLAVWRDGARYSVWSEIGRSGSYAPTGMEFHRLSDVAAYLSELEKRSRADFHAARSEP